MKKLIFSVLVFLGFALSASAKIETIYAFGLESGNFAIKYMIDRDAKKFQFDSDSPDDANMLMKNYKKVGNKETFDLYPEIDPNTKLFSVELIIDTTQKTVTDLKSQTITIKQNGKVTENFSVKTQEQMDAEKAANAQKSKATPTAKAETQDKAAATRTPEDKAAATPASEDKTAAAPAPEDKAESGVKKALNKGLGVFKKKK